MKFKCPYCHQQRDPKNAARTIRKIGTYYRKSDGQYLSRLWCFRCGKSFSAATSSRAKGQKKRHLNTLIKDLLTGEMSQREIARVLKINRKTVVRKFRFAAATAKQELRAWNKKFPKSAEVEFDDLETFEHTKCKPLSVTLMVEYKTRRILGFEVAQMPAKGLIAAYSRKKYGHRSDHRPDSRKKLLSEMTEFVQSCAVIRSDSNPSYPADVKRYFPNARHDTVLGGRGAVVGQGELKKLKWDPIFSLNHTCAMLRANINRLIRKTWCTTKKPGELAGHIALYALRHNKRLAATQ
ncbi:IS1 family transposase [Bdellovibrio sp. KM01]|uniref:IS1 family transposase n=1 Tax=Bdellovibrio sp. KM01 TaxID=2748865 RepID=UPI0015E98153|nr:IS1 family transposase [Bdellovibrio sp. KM01]QLY26947.1 IS1 family transposase [Bdellovibrio sp. KM01]